jgi:hypothetical protein
MDGEVEEINISLFIQPLKRLPAELFGRASDFQPDPKRS